MIAEIQGRTISVRSSGSVGDKKYSIRGSVDIVGTKEDFCYVGMILLDHQNLIYLRKTAKLEFSNNGEVSLIYPSMLMERTSQSIDMGDVLYELGSNQPAMKEKHHRTLYKKITSVCDEILKVTADSLHV